VEWFVVPLFLLIGVGGLILLDWALVDAIRVPDESMFKSGNRIIWVLVIVLAVFFGAIIHLVVGRPSEADRARKPTFPSMPPPPPGSLG
jgi:hypothetical protein